MNEIRCKKCNGLLLKGKIIDIEIKCRKCGYVSHIWNYGHMNYKEMHILTEGQLDEITTRPKI